MGGVFSAEPMAVETFAGQRIRQSEQPLKAVHEPGGASSAQAGLPESHSKQKETEPGRGRLHYKAAPSGPVASWASGPPAAMIRHRTSW